MSERKGFTLIEVLIAMVILGVGIIAIFKMFPDSLRQARVAAERTIVAELASSRLGQVRAAGAENLLRSTPSYLSAVTTAAGVSQSGSMYDGYSSSVQRMRGAEDTYLQRVTFSVKMPDGRLETFVTYVAKQ